MTTLYNCRESVIISRQFIQIRLNLGRVCLSLSLYEEAAATFSAVDPATFESLCGLAAASNLAGRQPESYAAYQRALSEAPETSDKSDVLAAMASIAYKFRGADAAKTLLFQSCQVFSPPPSV